MAESESNPPLPRLPEDPENLRRLRREALRRMEEDEERMPVVIYGGPPPQQQDRPPAVTIYGGPPIGGSGVTRRWTLKRILIVIAALIAGLTALFLGTRKVVAPVYGGPPLPPEPRPAPDRRENAPVYGGPPMSDREPRADEDQPTDQDPYMRDQRPAREAPRDPADSDGSSPATVYGGPPLQPQEPPQ